jgi:predicted ATPase
MRAGVLRKEIFTHMVIITKTCLPNSPFSKRNFSSKDDKDFGDFDLVRKYNSLINSGEIEENGEQNRVINELQAIGEKSLTHVKLLQEYKAYKAANPMYKEDIASKTVKPKQSLGSSFFGGLFGTGEKEVEEVVQKPKTPTRIKTELPPQFQKLEEHRGVYLWGGPGTGKTYLMDMFYNELPSERK